MDGVHRGEREEDARCRAEQHRGVETHEPEEGAVGGHLAPGSFCIMPKTLPSVSFMYASQPMPGIGIFGSATVGAQLLRLGHVPVEVVHVHRADVGDDAVVAAQRVLPLHQSAVDARLARPVR